MVGRIHSSLQFGDAGFDVLERGGFGGVIQYAVGGANAARRRSRLIGGMTAFPWLADGVDTHDFCRRLAKRGVLIVLVGCLSD